ncbi:MAG: hypothetical protein WCC06_06465 [Candidatus Aminicenantales bacterium]
MFSEKLKEITRLYPGLAYTQNGEKRLWKGTFKFCALYERIEDKFVLNPLSHGDVDDRIIQDSYEIEIEFLSERSHSFPEVREVGGRIQKIIDKFNITDPRELHINKNQNSTICLCPKPELFLRYPNGVDLVDFFNALVLPYFYGLSYFERHKEWPRGSYDHGDAGIFEFYLEHRDKTTVDLVRSCIDSVSEKLSKDYMQKKGNIKGHWECICGSKSKIRDRHFKALEGLRLLKEDIRRLSIKLPF